MFVELFLRLEMILVPIGIGQVACRVETFSQGFNSSRCDVQAVTQVDILQIRRATQVLKIGVGNTRLTEIETVQIAQAGDRTQAIVSDRRIA